MQKKKQFFFAFPIHSIFGKARIRKLFESVISIGKKLIVTLLPYYLLTITFLTVPSFM